jgi:hypothetical protein
MELAAKLSRGVGEVPVSMVLRPPCRTGNQETSFGV